MKKTYLQEIGLQAQTTILRFDHGGWSQNCGYIRDKHGAHGAHPQLKGPQQFWQGRVGQQPLHASLCGA